MPYSLLAQNIADQIMEEQAKLGFDEKEIRLYYPLSSLCHILEKSCTVSEMEEILQGFSENAGDGLGHLRYTLSEDRFCFHIPAEGVKWVYEHTPENAFIRQLVGLIVRPGCKMDDIETLFRANGETIVQPMNSEEFDTLMYFKNGPDKYYYCFQDDGFDIRYHRFLPGDYRDFGY